MRHALAWLAATGCTDGGPGADAFATLAVALDGEPASDARVQVDTLQVTVDRMLFEGDGPAGQQSVVLDVDETFSVLLDEEETMDLVLRAGAHDGAGLTVEAAVDSGGSAIVATGRVVEPDDDDLEPVPFRVEVDAIELVLDAGTVNVPEGGTLARVRLHPTEWLEGLPFDDDGLTVGPGSGAAYERLLANIAAAVTLDPPEPVE